jgi:competence protein ComGC
MGYSNSRGQGIVEAMFVLLVLSVFILTAVEISKASRNGLPHRQLSKENR